MWGPILLAVRSKAYVCDLSIDGNVVAKVAEVMDVRLLCLLCVLWM
jgi:hypothetical protein